ncbi:L-shaped tail fiber [Serratia phage Slocum]|nr:L-shaped tail fiber [Serratia phage Slocum]
MAVTTKIIMQQLLATDQGASTVSKFPRYVVSLGNSISSITAAELTDAVNKANQAATNAKTSETNSANSATAAKTSETNAKTSETNAKTSETNAAASAAQMALRMPWYTLPITGQDSRYCKVAELNIPGNGANHLNIIISGTSSYGNPMHQTETVTISARNLSGAVDITQAASVMRHTIVSADNRFRNLTGRVRFGVVKNGGILELWAILPAFISGCSFGIIAYTPATTTIMQPFAVQAAEPANFLLSTPNWNYSVDNPPAATEVDAVRKSGDTMTGDLTIGPDSRVTNLYLGGARFRSNSVSDGSLVISAPPSAAGDIIFRPNGDVSSAGEVRVRGSTATSGPANTLYASGNIDAGGVFSQAAAQTWSDNNLVKVNTFINNSVTMNTIDVVADTDWNKLKSPGMYKVQNGSTGTNKGNPTWEGSGVPNRTGNVYGYGVLIVYKGKVDAENRVVQEYHPHRLGEGHWTRIANGNTTGGVVVEGWNPWTYIPPMGELNSWFIRSDGSTTSPGVSNEFYILGNPNQPQRQAVLRFYGNSTNTADTISTIFADNTGLLRIRPGDTTGRVTSMWADGSVNFTPTAASAGVMVNNSKVITEDTTTQYSFVIAQTGGDQWVRMGTVSQLFQGGNTLDIDISGSGGYNAFIYNTGVTKIQVRTANGQGALATPFTTGRATAAIHNVYGMAVSRVILVETSADTYDVYGLFPANTRNTFAKVHIKSTAATLAQWKTINAIVSSSNIPTAGRMGELAVVSYLNSDSQYAHTLNANLTMNGTSVPTNTNNTILNIKGVEHTPLIIERTSASGNVSMGFRTLAGLSRLGIDTSGNLSFGPSENQTANPTVLTTANASTGAFAQGNQATYEEAAGVPWNAPSGSYTLNRAGGPDHVVQFYNGTSTNNAAKSLQLRVRYSQGGLWYRSSRDLAGFEVDWTQIFTSRHPPTATQVGSVAATGGTFTGNVNVNGTAQAPARLSADEVYGRNQVMSNAYIFNDMGDSLPPGTALDRAPTPWMPGIRGYNTGNVAGYPSSAFIMQFRMNENRHFQLMYNPATKQFYVRGFHVNDDDPAFAEVYTTKRPPNATAVGAYSKSEADAIFQKATPSDRKLKENVRYSMSSATDKIRKIKLFEFDFTSTAPTSVAGKHVEHGFVAQQLETVDPDFVGDNGAFKYPELLPLVALGIKGVQELADMVTSLQNRVAELEAKLK